MEFTPSSPIAIKSTSDSFEASSYLSSFAESYRRSYGYAFERRISNTATVFISRSPEQSPIRRESIEIPQEIYEQAPLLDYDESSTPKSSTYESIFNATNILMGIGILSLPYALKLTGWMIGLTLLLLFSLATRHTAMTVQKCMDAVVPDHLLFDQCRTFGDFVIYLFHSATNMIGRSRIWYNRTPNNFSYISIGTLCCFGCISNIECRLYSSVVS